jgi:hypothetical protein
MYGLVVAAVVHEPPQVGDQVVRAPERLAVLVAAELPDTPAPQTPSDQLRRRMRLRPGSLATRSLHRYPSYKGISSCNFESNNDCKSTDYRNLGHEVECDTANVLRAALGWGPIQRNRKGAWDQLAHGELLGEGDGTASPPEGRTAETTLDARREDLEIVGLSVSITVGSLTRSKPGLGFPTYPPSPKGFPTAFDKRNRIGRSDRK